MTSSEEGPRSRSANGRDEQAVNFVDRSVNFRDDVINYPE